MLVAHLTGVTSQIRQQEFLEMFQLRCIHSEVDFVNDCSGGNGILSSTHQRRKNNEQLSGALISLGDTLRLRVNRLFLGRSSFTLRRKVARTAKQGTNDQ